MIMTERVKSRRSYRAPTRQLRAEATRQRILQAARQLFRQRGYPSTTLAQIASAAGVATPTIYARFGSKLALLQALLAETSSISPAVRDLLQQRITEPDPHAQILLLARIVRVIYVQSWDIIEILRAAGTADSDAAAAWREADLQARAAQEPFIRTLANRGILRTGLLEREAADLLWALGGPDLYRLLVVESGWSDDQYELWLAQALATQLLGTPQHEKQ